MSGAPTFAEIEAAGATVAGAGLVTPQIASLALTEISGARVHLKLENLQPTGSFKVRGALIKMERLSEKERAAGVIAASAGNHAQGVAFHARRLDIRATIVMPRDTPFTKIRDTERLGAQIVLEGENLSESWAAAERLSKSKGLTMIHPYDDAAVIAGQGTVGLEFLRAVPDLDCLIVPVGGGGLIGGIALAAKHLNPAIEIVGTEATLFPAMRNRLKHENRTVGGRTIAEGIAVRDPGAITAGIVAEHVSDIILVSEDEIERAMLAFVRAQRLVVEGAGAAPLAALLQQGLRFKGRNVGLIVSGGNVDARVLSSILLRGLARDGHLVRLRVEIEDRPGELAEIAEIIGKSGGNIVEVVHQRLFHDIPVRQAEVDVTLETRDIAHVRELLQSLAQAGYPARLLSATADDE